MDDLAATFDELRPQLLRVAYSALGSLSEAAQAQERIVGAFVEACRNGDLGELLAVLDPDVVSRSDGGGHVPSAQLPLEGAERVGRALLAVERKLERQGRRARGRMHMVNGAPGLVVLHGDVLNVLSFTIDARRIVALDVVRNPEKL